MFKYQISTHYIKFQKPNYSYVTDPGFGAGHGQWKNIFLLCQGVDLKLKYECIYSLKCPKYQKIHKFAWI